MAGYVLFFSDEHAGNSLLLERTNLAALLGDAHPEWNDCTGPNQHRGMLAAWRLGNPQIDPAMENVEREWRELPACEGREEGKVWLGIEKARPIVPRDIARRSFLNGEWVTLADGQSWYIPVAEMLPRRGQKNRLGGFERVVLERYQAFYEKSAELYANFVGGVEQARATRVPGEVEVTFDDGYEFCWEAIALNYRVTPDVLSVLGVLDDTCLVRILMTVICGSDISDFAFKKKESFSLPVC